jgi:hypothetical protein
MNVQSLLKEYTVELDDVRWHLARQSALRLLEYRDRLDDLCRLIWSGRLEADLYNMEERFIEDLQEKLDKRQSDESEVRKILAEIVAARSLR